METIIWISLYILQTIVGAVLWRKYDDEPTHIGENARGALFYSSTVVINILGILIILVTILEKLSIPVFSFIDFLAGKNERTVLHKMQDSYIKCTGNNGNGCYLDSCGHNCGCEGTKN